MARKIKAETVLKRLEAGELGEDDLAKYFVEDDEQSSPFGPHLTFNPETVDFPEEGEAAVRSALSLNALNRLSRLRRLTEFNRRIREGYDGPRLAAEGDSWFQYPLLLTDTIDHINGTYPVLCSSAAGDLLSGMLEEREYIDAIKDSGADVLLLSAGGNDVCAGGSLATHLEKYSPGLRAADYLKPSYSVLFSNALGQYERIFRDVHGRFPKVTVVCHGYDYAIPNHGRWLGKPMESRGIKDSDLQREITSVMIDRFNGALMRLAERLPNVRFVDCRGTVADDGWHDELHPKSAGYGDVAKRMLDTVNEVLEEKSKPKTRGARSRAAAVQQPKALSLHVGVNRLDTAHYAGWDGLLMGCENDAKAMRTIAEAEGFEPTLLLSEEATRERVVEVIKNASKTLDDGDMFFFSVSAHGGQIEDYNHDETRREGEMIAKDETLCLHDSQIVDDELFDLWSRFAPGVRIVVVADTCHSGSMIRAGLPSTAPSANPDQPMTFAERIAASMGGPRIREMPAEIAEQVLLRNAVEYRNRAQEFRHVDEKLLTNPLTTPLKASVLQIGACQDWQFAADGDEYGAFTAALLAVWRNGQFDGDYRDFHKQISETIEVKSQTPSFEMLQPIDPQFPDQRPLSVFGGPLPEARSRYASAAARSAGDLARSAGPDLLGDEGAENDVPPEDRDRSRSRARSAPGVAAETLRRFRDFLAPLRLEFFNAEEFLQLGGGHGNPSSPAFGRNSAPPESLWGNIVRTAEVLDLLRKRLGTPISISNAYRNPDYNALIGGKPQSWHRSFHACDVQAGNGNQRSVADELTRMADEGIFKGGIGRYRTFTHIDTRGFNARWNG